MKSKKFVDRVTLYAKGGNGGDGCVSFRREKFVPLGGPDGGDGGNGGNVILVTDANTDSLLHLYYAPHQRGERGTHGKGKKLYGKGGKDTIVKVPFGTEVRDAETGELIADLVEEGDQVLVTRGGEGGNGNAHGQTSTHRAPHDADPGEEGEEKTLHLRYKTVSDVGFVGFPNAGKSSLLSVLSDAHPKIAPYPFTTLHPIVGTAIMEDYSSIKLVDIAGLIEGAHDGVGLGHAFLRHIERARTLMFVIDMSGIDGRNPVDDYRNLVNELKLYQPDLVERPSIVAANKMDAPESEPNLQEFIEETERKPIPVSATTRDGVDELKNKLQLLTSGEYVD